MEEQSIGMTQERNYGLQILSIIRSTHNDDTIRTLLEAYHENDIASVFEELTTEERDRLLAILGSERMSEIVSFLDDAGDYLSEIDAAIESEHTFACDDNGEQIPFSAALAKRISVITMEEAVEKLALTHR